MNEEILELYTKQKEITRKMHSLLKKQGIINDEFKVFQERPKISPIKLVQLVEEVFDVDIKKKNRKQSTIFGRKAGAYILRNYTGLSLNEIAEYIGVTDHTTVLYSVKTANNLIETEDWYREKIAIITNEIQNYSLFLKK